MSRVMIFLALFSDTYSLGELLAQSDSSAEISEEDATWLESRPAGKELLMERGDILKSFNQPYRLNTHDHIPAYVF